MLYQGLVKNQEEPFKSEINFLNQILSNFLKSNFFH